MFFKFIVTIFFLLIFAIDRYSNFDEMLLLETELPDELMAGGSSSWEQQMVTNKPPAQGPGPGQQMYSQQMNGGEDTIVTSNVNLQRQQQQQQLAHLLQQNKNSMVGNAQMSQLTNKSPNLQGAPNATVMNNMGVNMNNAMSMAPNNNGTNAMPMQQQGKYQIVMAHLN